MWRLHCSEHHELTRELDMATNAGVAAGVQEELEKLEARMSTKAEQIAKLSAYQSKVCYVISADLVGEDVVLNNFNVLKRVHVTHKWEYP